MLLALVILADEQADPYIDRLLSHGYRVTLLNSTGGFLGLGQTSCLIAIEEAKQAEILEIIGTRPSVEQLPTLLPHLAVPATNYPVAQQSILIFLLPLENIYRF